MKRIVLLLATALMTTTLSAKKTNKDLAVQYSSYIVSEHDVRLFDRGLMHRDIFTLTCEPHSALWKFRNKYDKIKSVELFIKNDCSKKCQLIVITFKDGAKKRIPVDDYLVYTETNDSPQGYAVKTDGPFFHENLLAKLPIISTDSVMLASKSW